MIDITEVKFDKAEVIPPPSLPSYDTLLNEVKLLRQEVQHLQRNLKANEVRVENANSILSSTYIDVPIPENFFQWELDYQDKKTFPVNELLSKLLKHLGISLTVGISQDVDIYGDVVDVPVLRLVDET